MTEDIRNRTRLRKWLWKDIHLERPVERPQQFTQFIDSIHSTDQPTLFFLHVLLPHIPYRMLPSGRMSLRLLLCLLAVGSAALAVQVVQAVPQVPGFVLKRLK